MLKITSWDVANTGRYLQPVETKGREQPGTGNRRSKPLFKEVPGKKKTATEEERLLHIPSHRLAAALQPLAGLGPFFFASLSRFTSCFALFFFLQLFAFPSLFRLRIELYSCRISSVAGGKRERETKTAVAGGKREREQLQ
jgi:hypothetical protein